MESRLPQTLSISMVLHATGVGVWLYMNQISKENQSRVISNVELMVAVRPAAARAPMPPSTWNFLKMALPSVPRQAPLEVQAPKELRPKIAQDRMLQENQERLRKSLALEAEKDLGHHRASLEALNAADLNTHVTHARLAEASRLEEVGTHRASRAAIAMDEQLVEERASGRARPQDISAMAAAQAPARSQGPAPMETLTEEAAPAGGGRASGGVLSSLANLLPTEEAAPGPRTRGYAAGGGGDIEAAPAPARRKAEAITERKKTAMIEGPLKGRRVVHYEIPKFPSWLQAQGVLEAVVRIRFTVSPSGDVLEETRLVQTSGYGDLDRLAIDSLSHWRFQAISEESGNQWGIITFRFVME